MSKLLLDLGNLLRKIGLRGLTGVDFILTDENHLIILEVNPRYTATMELYEHLWEQSLMALHVGAFQDTDMVALESSSLAVAGKQIIYANQSVVITNELIGQFLDLVADHDLDLADIPHHGTSIRCGRCCDVERIPVPRTARSARTAHQRTCAARKPRTDQPRAQQDWSPTSRKSTSTSSSRTVTVTGTG